MLTVPETERIVQHLRVVADLHRRAAQTGAAYGTGPWGSIRAQYETWARDADSLAEKLMKEITP